MTSASHFTAAEGDGTGSSLFCTIRWAALRADGCWKREGVPALCFIRASGVMTSYQASLWPAQRPLTGVCLAGMKI